jgi:hypothetical protein
MWFFNNNQHLGDALKRIYNLWRTPNRETDLTDDFAASPMITLNEWHPHGLKNALGYKLLILVLTPLCFCIMLAPLSYP